MVPIELRPTDEGLSLFIETAEVKGTLFIDFTHGKVGYRSRHGTYKKDPLAKALGLKPSQPLTVIDATAGLGQDGFLLASLGCKVTLIERNFWLAELLKDALARAHEKLKDHFSVFDHLKLVQGEACVYLSGLIEQEETVDVVYLDPMFPLRKKTALNSQSMRLLDALVETSSNNALLFDLAYQVATQRVVVKRPLRAPPLITSMQPSFVHAYRSCRFDVYLKGIKHEKALQIP